MISPSDKLESLMSTIKVSERQVEPALLVSRSCSDGISSDSLMVAGIEVGINSNGFVAKLMEDNNSCLDGKSFNSTAVNGLEVGTNSDGLVVASMEINCIFSTGFNFGGHAGFVDFGVNSVDKVGSECSVLLIQGADNKGTRPIDMGEIGQPNLALMELKLYCGLSILGVSMVEEVAFSEVVLGEESLTDCNLLSTVIPLGLALLMEVHNDSEVLDIGGTFDVSNWVKNRIQGFSQMIGLSVNRHEKLCIAYLQRLKREMEVIN